jgi:hypothetical protein
VLERPNPVGDSAFHPFDEQDLRALLRRLLGGRQSLEEVVSVLDDLFRGVSGGAALSALSDAGPLPRRPLPAHH